MIMQVTMNMKWNELLYLKEKKIIKNNELENAKRFAYQYDIRVFIKIMHDANSYIRPTKVSKLNEGLYEVVEIYANRTVKIQRGGYREILSITRIAPFFKKDANEE